MVDGWWVDAVSCTWMSVVRARRVGLRGNGRGVGEGDAGQVSGGEADAAAAGASTLASAMVTREVKVIVGAATAVVEHTAGERA